MFENQYRSYVIQDPFLRKLASAGADMTNYFGVFHPSQTNYLASLAGEICAVTNDEPPASPLMQENLVDLLEAKNVTWKAYMEGYPNQAWNPDWKDPNYPKEKAPISAYPPDGDNELSRYYRKHNAFASFHSVQRDENRWNKIVSDAQFWKDVHDEALPQYCWFTPDIWNDGHYLYNTHLEPNPRIQLVPQLSAWLEYVFLGNIECSSLQGGLEMGIKTIGLNLDVDLLLTNPKEAWEQSNIPKGTLLVITFDEADYDAEEYDTLYDGPNQIYTVLLGDMIEPGTVISTPYNHYNLIRTVQKNYGLGSLKKNDHGANWFRFLWHESFTWNLPKDTGFPGGNALAISHGKEGEHMVFSDTKGNMYDSILGKSGWNEPRKLKFKAAGEIAMTSIGDQTILVTKDEKGELMMATYDASKKAWTDLSSLNHKSSGSIAMTTYLDWATMEDRMMLCWVSEEGFIQSMQGNTKGFHGDIIPVGQLTDGPMVLGQVGAALFLVYKERNTRKMRMTAYNTAPFNAFDAVNFEGQDAPENNTTVHQWSVSDFAVGHFSKKMAALANEYQNLGNMTMSNVSGEMHLVHRGGYPDLPHAYTAVFGLTGIYASASQLSNGYGTLNQAGWTIEKEMKDMSLEVDGPLSMCSNTKSLTLVWADADSKTIKFRQGGYTRNT